MAESPTKTSTVEIDRGRSTNQSRGDKTPLELFLAGVAGWDSGLIATATG